MNNSGISHKYVTLRESRFAQLEMDEIQLAHLRQLSRDLAGSKNFWGSEDSPESRVIEIRPCGGNSFEVKVHNAIGAIALPGITLIVEPKIPIDHFVYIASRAFSRSSRNNRSQTSLKGGLAFHSLVCSWLLGEAEILLRGGLVKDYKSSRESLKTVRGSIHLATTTMNWFRGATDIDSTVDDFTVDTPANRLIRAALQIVTRSNELDEELRKRAQRLIHHFSGVGSYKSTHHVSLKDVPPSYREVVSLAKQVLEGQGRALDAGTFSSRTFLFKTPDLIESGLTNLINTYRRVGKIKKRGLVLTPTTMKVQPDLVMGEVPFTGDVKYKIQSGEWMRADLAQAVFFASAFRSRKGLVISFAEKKGHDLKVIPVGPIEITPLIWFYGEGLSPEQSADDLVDRFNAWYPDETYGDVDLQRIS